MQQQPSPVNEATRAIRTLEERHSNLLRRIQLVEQNMLTTGKKNHTEFKSLNTEMMEFKEQISLLNDKIDTVIKELHSMARKEEVEVLKKYLNLWEPVNFATHNEVEKIVKEMLEEKA